MKLLYPLSEDQRDALRLGPGEDLLYCVPVDLAFDSRKRQAEEAYADSAWLVVTQERLAVLEGESVAAEFRLAECARVRCEHQVHSGIVTVTKKDGQAVCAARCSMRHIVRVAYVARGAQTVIEALERGTAPERVESLEYEKYCGKCGRALPGTSSCPYCGGKLDILKKFLILCGDAMGRILLISLVMLLISILKLALPMVQRTFIDGALAEGGAGWGELWTFIGTTFVLMAARILLNMFHYWQCMSLGTALTMDLRRRLYCKIQALSLSFIDSRKPGELLNRVSGDTRQIRRFMEDVFGDMCSVLLTMAVSLAVMFTISWRMTLLSLLFVVLAFSLTRAFRHRIHSLYHRQQRKNDDLASGLQDIISGIRVVKSFGKEEREAARFREKAGEYAEMSRQTETFWALVFPILTFLMGAGGYVAVYLGGADVLEGKMSVGQLVQFMAYSGYLFEPLGWMSHMPRLVMQMVTSLNRIYDVLDEEPAVTDKEGAKFFPIEGEFRFERVSFGYHSYEPVLEDVSFEVKPGEMIGLVGASGAGKSTLINLIMRLYDVDQGRITVDGVDLRDIRAESLHAQTGVVLQETFLFSGSILANIRFARQDAPLAEVIRAAKAANAHDFICRTPDGYNTYVGEHGYSLSGGERQRIAIARAILNDPRLLILDEATSALDTESEFLIQQALGRLVQGRTTFAIAHRLSTLRNADRLVVIDGHRIAEIGTHNELLEKKGIYYGLVEAQLRMAGGE